MSQQSILSRTALGAGWVVAWRMLTRVLGLISTLILVRLLAPADFGLVALATSFALALDACLSIGVEDQLVRSNNPRPALYHTAFTLNLFRCLAVAALIAFLAAPAAAFFGDARLYEVFLALAVSAGLSGLANVGVADFRRQLSFHKEFQLQLLPRLAGITVTLIAAWLLRSHWALILGVLVSRLGLVIMGHLLHPYRPRLSLEAWRELISVSAWSWAISVCSVIRDRADSMVIGRLLGPPALGPYAVGVELAVLPTSELIDPICRACMPGFAETLRNGGMAELGRAWLRIIALVAVLALPAGVGISLIAGPLVALLFGQGWLEAAPIVAILGLACTVMLPGNVSAALLNARAALHLITAITAGAAVLRIALLIVLTIWLGLPGAALAVGIALLVEHAALVTCALRMLDIRFGLLVRAFVRPSVAVTVMALVLWATGLGWTAPPADGGGAFWMLLQAVPLGALVFFAALALQWLLAGRPAGAEWDLMTVLRTAFGRVFAPRPVVAGQGG